jgi:hypothetical protein
MVPVKNFLAPASGSTLNRVSNPARQLTGWSRCSWKLRATVQSCETAPWFFHDIDRRNPIPGVVQTVGFGLGMSKILYLSRGID